jgi:1,4-alpha-glucan branching enzyme
MACGIPVIGTAIGGVRELLRHGNNGFTYAPGQVEELATRMLEIQLQPVLCRQVVETAQEEVLSQYNDVVTTDRIEGYLEASREHWSQLSS